MNNKSKPLHKVFGVVVLGTLLIGCQSTPDKMKGVSVIQGTHIDQIASDLNVLMEKQKQHDQLLIEWQQLKPALSRLAVAEEELGLLLIQLEQLALATSESPEQTSGVSNSSTSSVTKAAAPVKADKLTSSIVPALSDSNSKRFALQIASLSEPSRLPAVWAQLQKKYPQLMNTLEANVERITVGQTNYYRLKIGAFADKKQAVEHCNKMKLAGVNCLVANYVFSDFSTLPKQ
ncbi:SPOR domain-containing protein [Rheinheimera gaetbuli]